jgi:hypothetical protein
VIGWHLLIDYDCQRAVTALPAVLNVFAFELFGQMGL